MDGISAAAADILARLASGPGSGPVSVVLSGGSTPRALYRLLASARYRGSVPWERVHLFFGDERCVPPDDPESNYRMVEETLLAGIDIPLSNVHRIRGELPPDEAARLYEGEVRGFLDGTESRGFDLVFLGLGADGHTLSIFPGGDVPEETGWAGRGAYGGRLCVETNIKSLGSWRVTMTLPLVNRASHVVFLVSGAGKREALRDVLEGRRALPAGKVRPASRRVTWLVDEAAAGLLGG